MAAKYLAWLGHAELAKHAAAWTGLLGDQLGNLVVVFVRPGEIPVWQLASAANAVLALAMFLAVRRWALRAEKDLAINEPRIERVLSVAYFVRRLFTSYAIVNNLIVLYYLARELPLPPIGSQFFRVL
ncbi:MAG: hypothetical protein ACKVZJ_04605 [Phycisphaerales bacterium]